MYSSFEAIRQSKRKSPQGGFVKKQGSIASLFGIGAISLCLSGCASIISGTTQQLTFQSNPDGATVTISGRVIGKTPVTTTLKKAAGQSLLFSKDGYQPLSMNLDTHLDGWFWGNIVLGGLIGSTTDNVSGAVNEYSPSQYMVTLQPEGTTRLESKTSLSENQKAKDYIVSNYKSIVEDLQKGGGQYLASLFQTLNIPEDQKTAAIKKTKALSEAYTDIPEFADHVIELLYKR